MYKNYVFDLYGTLVDIHTNEEKHDLWKKLCEIYAFNGAHYTPTALKNAYKAGVQKEKQATQAAHAPYMHIDIRLEAVFAALYRQKGVHPDRALLAYTAQFFRAVSTKYIRLYDGAKALLHTLKTRGKKLYLLTNAQRCFTIPELTLLEITDLFDGIVISSDEYTKKPDPAFYTILLDRYGLKAAESIMVGNDCTTDIKGAQEAGLDSLYIHSNLSPEIDIPLSCTYKVMDGNVHKIKELIL